MSEKAKCENVCKDDLVHTGTSASLWVRINF